MKTKILFVIIIMFYSVKAFSLWDLLIRNHTNDDIEVTMKMLSIPFEGSVHFTQFNRFPPVALNGSIHKRFYNSTDFHQWNILKHVFVLTPGHPNTSEARLRSCFGEESGSLTENFPFWGYGRYLITFKNLDHPEKTLNFYWNSLDSKLGTQDYYNNLSYGSDWSMDYEVINNEYRVNIGGQRIVPHAHNINRYVYSENQFDEFYQWDLILNQSSPVAKEFFGRITPFPISKADAETTIRVLNLETDILMDQVYPNNGTQDRYGYNTINNPYYNNPPVPFSTTGKTIMTPATTFDPDQTPSTGDEVIGIKIVIDQGSKLTIGEDIDFWVHGLLTQGDSLFIDGGTIELKQNAGLYCINGGKIIYNSGNLSFLNTSDIRAFAFTSLEFNISEEINNGSRIKIDGDATLKLGDNVTLTFDGNTSYLDLASNSNIKFGTNSKLVFKNGAYLKADDVTFTGLTTSTIYDGIVLENAGSQTSIKNCTFNNFKTAIKIENTNSTSVNNQKIIQGNDFNYNTASNYGIYAIRLNTALIDDNDFDMSAIGQAGVYIQQPLLDVGEGAGGGEAPTTLNIINNRFNNTGNGIILAGFTSSNIHAFVKGNTTTNSRLGLLARNVSGEIKDNNINASSTQLGTGIFLTESNPDLFDNIIYSYGQSIYLGTGSSPYMAPHIPSSENIEWNAGKNKLTSINSDNLTFQSSFTTLNRGHNNFIRLSSSANNIYGQISGNYTTLSAVNNCWSPYPPVYYIYNTASPNNQPVQLIHSQTPGFSCTPASIVDFTLIDKGYGVFDTIFITANGDTYVHEEDEAMFGSANAEQDNGDYFTAITGYKNLIDNYTNSSYLLSTLNNLYECHTYLDTFDTEEETDILYGSLKTYLEAKINSESYSSSFESEAYNIILSCEANMKNYEQAVEGYEFIALYHPDPEVRLLSSQDYAIIEDLLNGEGGSQSNKSSNLHNISVSKEIDLKLKKLEKRIAGDPILSKVKSSYEESSRKNKEEINKELNKETDAKKLQKINQLKQNEERINDRVRNNLIMFKHLSKEDKEKRLFEDILLSSSAPMDVRQSDDVNELLPNKYTLSQNYPNPFNPVTTINYQLPRDGIISLIIYDITGKQAAQIENGFKTSGSYSITFDGSQLSSGVYFYKLTAGNFSEVKRMLMIK